MMPRCGKRLLKSTLAASSLFAAAAQSRDAAPRFEIASVRRESPDPRVQQCLCEPPGRVVYRAAPLKWILERAFELQDAQIQGPGWLDSETFHVEAKLPAGARREDTPAMLRALLEERFHLAAHRDQREIRSFILSAAPGGTKLKAPADGEEYRWRGDKTGIHLRQRTNMKDFASYLSTQLDSPVADETGLDGVYFVKLDFAPDALLAQSNRADLAPPLADALLQQLGLKLESKKRTVQMLVIDHIERAPDEN